MEQIGEIVYQSTMGKDKEIVNQFIKTEKGYLRQQIFPTGVIYEGDYTQEEFDKVMEDIKTWDALVAAKPKITTKGKG